MNKLLRSWLFYVITLRLIADFNWGFYLKGGIEVLFIASFLFMLIDSIFKPLFKLIALPLSLLTFGFFNWLVELSSFALLIYIYPQAGVQSFYFSGFNWFNLTIPAYIVKKTVAFIVNFFLFKIIKKILWVTAGN